jgi:hypothetical protein
MRQNAVIAGGPDQFMISDCRLQICGKQPVPVAAICDRRHETVVWGITVGGWQSWGEGPKIMQEHA